MLLVVRHGTITAASKKAHLTQPALSASIKRLEERVGARLFDRGRHGAALTAAGQAMLPRAEAAIAAWDDGRRAVAEVMGLDTGEVRVAAGATVTTYLLPPTLLAFRQLHPRVRLRVREAYTEAIHQQLRAGAIDLGIVSGDGNDPWLCDQLVLVAAPSLFQVGVDEPSPASGFVTFPEGSTTRMLLRRHFPDALVVMELSGMAAVKGNVRAGIGIALVSRAAVARDVAAGSLVEVPTPQTPITRHLSLVHRGIASLPPAAAKLRSLLLGA